MRAQGLGHRSGQVGPSRAAAGARRRVAAVRGSAAMPCSSPARWRGTAEPPVLVGADASPRAVGDRAGQGRPAPGPVMDQQSAEASP